jgi:hypothetical protein
MPEQRREATPVQSAARLPAHADGRHRIAVMHVLRDLIADHGEQRSLLARRRKLQHAVARGLEEAEHIGQRRALGVRRVDECIGQQRDAPAAGIGGHEAAGPSPARPAPSPARPAPSRPSNNS